jgi:hypothetical protein
MRTGAGDVNPYVIIAAKQGGCAGISLFCLANEDCIQSSNAKPEALGIFRK